MFVTASTDASIHMWDLRTLGPKARPLASAAHPQACQAAYFAPDGEEGSGAGSLWGMFESGTAMLSLMLTLQLPLGARW